MGRLAVLLYEFVATRKCSYVISLVVSITIGLIIFYRVDISKFPDFASQVRSDILTIMGILLGFSISVLAIFITSGNRNIEASKMYSTGIKLWKTKTISLFDKIVIDLSYVIICEAIILLVIFILPAFATTPCKSLLLTSAVVAISAHVVFVILGISLDLYLIVSKKEKRENE